MININDKLYAIIAESDVFIDVSLGYIKEKVAKAVTKKRTDL